MPALEHVLDAWRSSRDPAVADLVDTLGEIAGRNLPAITSTSTKHWNEAWLDVAIAGRASDIERLIAGWRPPTLVRVREGVDRFGQRPDDPRIALGLARFMCKFPSTYSAANAAWQALVKLVIRLRDVRCVSVLDAGRSPQELLNADFTRVRATLAEAEWDAADPHRVSRVRAALADLPAPPEAAVLATGEKAPERNEAELLKLICQSPADEGARLIYGDFLTERGDPRGEFIALQCKKSPSAAELKRLRALQREHGRVWLGAIEPAVERARRVFSRGFLSEARVRFKTPTQQRKLIAHPLWNTIEVLQAGPVLLDEFLLGCPLLGLRKITWSLDAALVAQMAVRREPYPQLETLILRVGDVEDEVLHAIGAATAFPKLSRVEFAGDNDRLVDFEWLLASALGKRLTALQLHHEPRSLREWLTRLTALPALQVFNAGWNSVEFARTGAGWNLKARFQFRRTPYAALSSIRDLVHQAVIVVQPHDRNSREHIEAYIAELKTALAGFEVIEE